MKRKKGMQRVRHVEGASKWYTSKTIKGNGEQQDNRAISRQYTSHTNHTLQVGKQI